MVDRFAEWLALAGSLDTLVGDRAPSPRSAPGWLRTVHAHLHDERTAGLARLAAGAGVHPVHLARQFRRHYRCSVSDYARALRLAAAVAGIAAGQGLAEAAHGAGYTDQAHLTRACRQELGLTPGRVRALLSELES